MFLDSFGVDLVLPNGAVCKICNNKLNREVDQRLKEIFQVLINRHGITGGKRTNGGAPATVAIETADGAVPGRMLPGGALSFLKLNGRLQERLDDRSDVVMEQWEGSPADVERMRSLRSAQLHDMHVEILSVSPIIAVRAALTGTSDVVVRSVARAGLNYLAYRRENDAVRPQLAAIRRFCIDGSAAGLWPTAEDRSGLFVRGFNFDGDVSTAPWHCISVGSDGPGTPIACSVIFFGAFHVRVFLAPSWPGPPFHAEGRFDALAREHVIVDRDFVRPSS